MKFILSGFVVFTLAVASGTDSVAVCSAADNPAAGCKREFRVVAVGLAEIKRRIADAEANVEEWKERLLWTERMSRKCGLSASVAHARARLQSAEIALHKLRETLKSFPPPPIGR